MPLLPHDRHRRKKRLHFEWFDDESEDWDYAKNCDEIGE